MEWKIISRFPDYQVSESGEVRRNGRTLRPYTDKWGYSTLSLRKSEGGQTTVSVHRIVAAAFLGPPPFEGAQACHNDSVKANNHYSNLRWDTPKGNIADKSVMGTENIGERNGRAKLTEADVIEIRRLSASGRRSEDIGADYNVCRRTIQKIIFRERWAHVA